MVDDNLEPLSPKQGKSYINNGCTVSTSQDTIRRTVAPWVPFSIHDFLITGPLWKMLKPTGYMDVPEAGVNKLEPTG